MERQYQHTAGNALGFSWSSAWPLFHPYIRSGLHDPPCFAWANPDGDEWSQIRDLTVPMTKRLKPAAPVCALALSESMRRDFLICVLTLGIGGSALPVSAGDHFFSNRQRTRTKCCLTHDYSESRWPFTEPRYFRKTVIAVAATDPTRDGKRRKPFHFRATALRLDQLTLDQVGLLLDQSGQFHATGRITHDGGDGGLIGNNIVVRVRAYVSTTGLTVPGGTTLTAARSTAADTDDDNTNRGDEQNGNGEDEVVRTATPNEVTRIPPDSYCVWESKHETWVSRGGPHYIKLAPDAEIFGARAILKHHFDDITHLEVELAYQRDR